MAVCLIVLGYERATRLDPGVLPGAGCGGVVVAGCNPCAATKRVTFPTSVSAPSGYTKALHDADELKPAETYVFMFDQATDADAWLDTNAHLLVRKEVYRMDPAISGP